MRQPETAFNAVRERNSRHYAHRQAVRRTQSDFLDRPDTRIRHELQFETLESGSPEPESLPAWQTTPRCMFVGPRQTEGRQSAGYLLSHHPRSARDRRYPGGPKVDGPDGERKARLRSATARQWVGCQVYRDAPRSGLALQGAGRAVMPPR